jgi:hypothetical protein
LTVTFGLLFSELTGSISFPLLKFMFTTYLSFCSVLHHVGQLTFDFAEAFLPCLLGIIIV